MYAKISLLLTTAIEVIVFDRVIVDVTNKKLVKSLATLYSINNVYQIN